MRSYQKLIISGLLLLVIACNFPTRVTTPAPVCTPPACQDNEVYYCPGECPGGCGTDCATPTGQAVVKDPTPGPTPTDTPFPMCTPPACQPDEQYYCEGECPGGCGTTCATPTPTQKPEPVKTKELPQPTSTPKPEVVTPPVIESFTADRSKIIQGENLNVTWVASGGAKAEIIWLGTNGSMEGVDNLPPDGSTVIINPINPPVILNVTNSAGTTSKNLELTIQCMHAWMPELQTVSTSVCPRQAETSWAAQQPFENGFMIWMESSQIIYVFLTQSTGQFYRTYQDTFKDGDLESDPTLTPPAGKLQPMRGFGKVWRENDDVRLSLGWATAGETGFETWLQSYQGLGLHNVGIWLKDINLRILELEPSSSAWKIYSP